MSRRLSGDKYPIFRALGTDHEFLDADKAAEATRDERIKSIWPFIVRRSKSFYRSLKPKERVNFDPEDALVEIWVALAKRDHKWSPERGKYITFAGRVIDHELAEIRDKARTVESPRNSTCRIKEYAAEEAAGTLTPQRKKTADDIKRTGDGAQAIGEHELPSRFTETPVNVLVDREAASKRDDAIKLAIRSLSTYEAAVIGRLCGLWGQPRQSAFWVAWSTGRDASEVRKAKDRAVQKIRDTLLSAGYSVADADD